MPSSIPLPAQTALPDAIARDGTGPGLERPRQGAGWWLLPNLASALPVGSLRGYWAPEQLIQPRGRDTLITRFTPGGGKGPPPPTANSLPPP